MLLATTVTTLKMHKASIFYSRVWTRIITTPRDVTPKRSPDTPFVRLRYQRPGLGLGRQAEPNTQQDLLTGPS
jgi:hypothetical protein